MKQVIGSKEMTVGEMINRAIEIRGVKKQDVAEKMGWKPNNFSNRIRNNSISSEEWIKLSAILGYEIQMVDMENKAILKQRKKSSGERVSQMIDGIVYDTDKADSICHSPKIYGGWFELFKDIATGLFFTVAYLETGGIAVLAPISKENAKKFYEDCSGEDADPDLFE